MVLLTTAFAAILGLATASPLLATDLTKRGQNTCTVDSFANTTTFVLKEYQVDTVKNGSTTQTIATMSVENPGSGDTYRLFQIPITTGGGTWSVCRAGPEPLPSQLVRCQYLIERPSHTIGFRFQWYCGSSTDAGKLVLFDATVVGELPTEVCVARDGTGGVTQSCALPATPLPLEVENIYWEDADTATS
ncbi:hypothetical protein B0H66DRAFT_636143 [Apodospora peruviana]|uniref:AA1-like domain-containing protein n=1 Tax=Apodospora peruviana TaxID=516989 RepID=A0AAE0HRV9_9PEZI|nr:hypothetical protein B0H66DRAFT_644951 [Apodospora peruviana]KAK3331237.1 hypothetical protein B0H66DRAFT_636143 [Apodospora peruviana]